MLRNSIYRNDELCKVVYNKIYANTKTFSMFLKCQNMQIRDTMSTMIGRVVASTECRFVSFKHVENVFVTVLNEFEDDVEKQRQVLTTIVKFMKFYLLLPVYHNTIYEGSLMPKVLPYILKHTHLSSLKPPDLDLNKVCLWYLQGGF